MPRIRTIKPEFWSHPMLTRLDDSARLAAIGLLNMADDEGYFLADPGLIRSFIWPLDDHSTNARRTIDDLSRIGYISLREHPTHGTIGHIVNFSRHQRVDRPNPSKIKGYFNSTNVRRSIDAQSTTEGNRERKGTGNGLGAGAPEIPPVPKSIETSFAAWVAMRRRKKFPTNAKYLARAIAHFSAMDPEDANAIMDRCESEEYRTYQIQLPPTRNGSTKGSSQRTKAAWEIRQEAINAAQDRMLALSGDVRRAFLAWFQERVADPALEPTLEDFIEWEKTHATA